MFEELGFEVVSSVGSSCANALHIAHVPDWAKEKAILELLATDENELDAVVQCGTNMSLIDVTGKLEPVIGVPILAINTVTFWYALRENGFETRLGSLVILQADRAYAYQAGINTSSTSWQDLPSTKYR